jgi:hypothetical protein
MWIVKAFRLAVVGTVAVMAMVVIWPWSITADPVSINEPVITRGGWAAGILTTGRRKKRSRNARTKPKNKREFSSGFFMCSMLLF